MPLSLHNSTLLNQAYPSSIETTLLEISANWPQGRWLLVNNRYSRNCIKNIKKDAKLPNRIIHKHLREYIAASSIIHCMDGWGYLGSGIEAHLKGNSDIARHLGYYAELRAAMSLLASEGIGVFNDIHFVVNNQKKCKGTIKGGGTHQFVWDALEYWAQTTNAVNLIFKVIQPGGLPLLEWIEHFAMTPSFRSILANKWLLQWGLDLQQLRDDREARNLSSYRPTAFSNSRAIDVREALRFVKNFWEICEPNESIRFPTLDRHLLRYSLELLFLSIHPRNRSRKQANRTFERQIETMLHGLAPRDLTNQQWTSFLNFSDSLELPLILDEAKAKDEPSSPRHHIQVLARATLLLRVATGASQEKLKLLPNFNRSDLEFWWDPLGVDRCLWHLGEPPDRFIDLWADIFEAVQVLDGWQKTSHVDQISYNKLWRDRPDASCIVGSCERVGFWGLGL
jgi:hypothetical protein